MAKVIDIAGQRFGKLVVLERDFQEDAKHPRRGSSYWKCKCDCGKEKSILKASLVTGKTNSCGCIRQEKARERMALISSNNYIDEIGNTYGKLTVLKKAPSKETGGAQWLCQCECGEQIVVSGNSLRTGNTCSCGCLGKSKGEYEIEKILYENNILFTREFPVIINNKRLRYDFGVFENAKIKYLIEFDGAQHFISEKYFGGEAQLKITQIHDLEKNKWCKENNIPLIRIPYTHLGKITKEDLILETSQFLLK